MGKMAKVLGSMLLFLMLALSGNTVFAHEDDDCACIDLEGAKRNKVVSDILKSDAFKVVKSKQKNDGYIFAGADQAMAVLMPGPKGSFYTMVAMPFVHENGTMLFSVFVDGMYMGDGPPPGHE